MTDYRGHHPRRQRSLRCGRFNAEVRILRHFPIGSKPHVETVTSLKLTAKHAEWSGELWVRR